MMKTREQVYELLKRSGSNYISGQEMAEKLYLTRTAVWKAIKALREEGHEIEAVTNKGYRLAGEIELPAEEIIDRYIREYIGSGENYEKTLADSLIKVYDSVESTNDVAAAFARENPGIECIIIADAQTKGRGRRGRDFYSPAGTGIYISFLIYPGVSFDKAMNYTCMMAECVCRAIYRVTGIETGIKWVNDIYYKDKKVAGILTEAMASLEDGELSHLIIGAGINLYMPYEGFPADIEKKAGPLLTQKTDDEIKDKLYAAIICEFLSCYRHPEKKPFVKDYISRSILVGKYVKMLPTGVKKASKDSGYALVTGIDEDCHLLVRYEDGTEEVISSGEVSVVKY